MPLDPELLATLVDPEDKGPLYYLEDEGCLYNGRTRRLYRINEGTIPNLLVEDSEIVSEDEHHRLAYKATTEKVPRTGPPEYPHETAE